MMSGLECNVSCHDIRKNQSSTDHRLKFSEDLSKVKTEPVPLVDEAVHCPTAKTHKTKDSTAELSSCDNIPFIYRKSKFPTYNYSYNMASLALSYKSCPYKLSESKNLLNNNSSGLKNNFFSKENIETLDPCFGSSNYGITGKAGFIKKIPYLGHSESSLLLQRPALQISERLHLGNKSSQQNHSSNLFEKSFECEKIKIEPNLELSKFSPVVQHIPALSVGEHFDAKRKNFPFPYMINKNKIHLLDNNHFGPFSRLDKLSSNNENLLPQLNEKNHIHKYEPHPSFLYSHTNNYCITSNKPEFISNLYQTPQIKEEPIEDVINSENRAENIVQENAGRSSISDTYVQNRNDHFNSMQIQKPASYTPNSNFKAPFFNRQIFPTLSVSDREQSSVLLSRCNNSALAESNTLQSTLEPNRSNAATFTSHFPKKPRLIAPKMTKTSPSGVLKIKLPQRPKSVEDNTQPLKTLCSMENICLPQSDLIHCKKRYKTLKRKRKTKTFCMPDNFRARGSKTRKPVKSTRSAEPSDPNFRGAIVSLKTQLNNWDCHLNISAHFCNVKNNESTLDKQRHGSGSLASMQEPWNTSDEENAAPYHRDFYFPGENSSKICASCSTRRTPLWRDAEDGTPLCNACGIRFKKYRVRCGKCWHIPKKEVKTYPNCPICGSTLRMSFARRSAW